MQWNGTRMCDRRWKIFVFIESLTFIVPSRRRLRSTFIRRNSRVLFGFTYFESQAYSSNVKILPILLSMIIRATYRKRGLSTNQRERSRHRWPGKDRVYCSWNPRFIQVTQDTFGRSKNRDLRYTKESHPYFAKHCVPCLLDRDVLFDPPRRGRYFLLRDIASRIYLDRNSCTYAHLHTVGLNPKARHAISWLTHSYSICTRKSTLP